jgi:hypothetical protein
LNNVARDTNVCRIRVVGIVRVSPNLRGRSWGRKLYRGNILQKNIHHCCYIRLVICRPNGLLKKVSWMLSADKKSAIYCSSRCACLFSRHPICLAAPLAQMLLLSSETHTPQSVQWNRCRNRSCHEDKDKCDGRLASRPVNINHTRFWSSEVANSRSRNSALRTVANVTMPYSVTTKQLI